MDEQRWITDTVEKIREKISWVSEKNKDKIPYTTDENGNYDDRSDSTKDWNADDGAGFCGCCTRIRGRSATLTWRGNVRKSWNRLSRISTGFTMMWDLCFCRLWWPTTGSQETRKRKRLRCTPRIFWLDVLIRREIIFVHGMIYRIRTPEAGRSLTADPRYRHIAMRHADSVMTHFIRKDGSVIHIGEFDPETGAFVKSHGGQGYGEGSAWTRGQGWALYGFVNSYTKSGMEECFRYVLLAQ